MVLSRPAHASAPATREGGQAAQALSQPTGQAPAQRDMQAAALVAGRPWVRKGLAACSPVIPASTEICRCAGFMLMAAGRDPGRGMQTSREASTPSRTYSTGTHVSRPFERVRSTSSRRANQSCLRVCPSHMQVFQSMAGCLAAKIACPPVKPADRPCPLASHQHVSDCTQRRPTGGACVSGNCLALSADCTHTHTAGGVSPKLFLVVPIHSRVRELDLNPESLLQAPLPAPSLHAKPGCLYDDDGQGLRRANIIQERYGLHTMQPRRCQLLVICHLVTEGTALCSRQW